MKRKGSPTDLPQPSKKRINRNLVRLPTELRREVLAFTGSEEHVIQRKRGTCLLNEIRKEVPSAIYKVYQQFLNVLIRTMRTSTRESTQTDSWRFSYTGDNERYEFFNIEATKPSLQIDDIHALPWDITPVEKPLRLTMHKFKTSDCTINRLVLKNYVAYLLLGALNEYVDSEEFQDDFHL